MKKTKKDTHSFIQKRSLTCFDSDQLSDVVKGASFELQQLDKGAFRSDLFSISLGKGILDRGYYNLSVLTEGTFSQENITFGFLHKAKANSRLNGEAIQQHDMLLCHQGASMDYNLAPGSLWSTFQCKRDDLLKTGIALPKNDTTIYRGNKEMQKAFSLKLEGIFNYLEEINETEAACLNQKMLYNHILESYAHTLDQGTFIIDLTQTKSAQLAKKIYQYLHEHAHEPLQMIDLTELTGKSERTVERIFKKHFNVSPYTYLKIHRLNHIRKQLMQADDPSTVNITQLVMSNGFMQMGYFGAEYKKTFGETPSQTLWRRH